MNDKTIKALNELSYESCVDAFTKCCGASDWCKKMAERRPFDDFGSLSKSAEQVFDELSDADWLEAFGCHPKIGDLNSLRMKFAGNKDWSAGEQSGVNATNEATLQSLAAGNAEYEAKFGYIFIICATGKSAAEMLELLQERLMNSAKDEIKIAAAEQTKITELRLQKLKLEN